MAYELWSQDVFSKGELSPFMYARATVNEYGNGLKVAQNVLTYPTGGAGKRFGTLFQQRIGLAPTAVVYFQTFQYLNECIYQLLFSNNNLFIMLEGTAQANVSLSFDDNFIGNISSTTLGSAFRIAGPGYHPYDLVRAPSTTVNINSIVSNVITIATATLLANSVFPVRFTSAISGSAPQIITGVTYFLKNLSSTTAMVFTSAYNAKFGINPIQMPNAGTANSLNVQNTWTIAPSVFRNVPVYDFNGAATSYDGITFTVTAATGNATVNLSAPYAPLDSSYVGGAFFGAGGSGRIIGVTNTSSFNISVQEPFVGAPLPISGTLVVLAEPAWSDKRKWPQVCSSYQNRSLFANTASLPNGFWASVINDYADFGDLSTDDDDAISWYPTSNDINFIRFIVPYRSITVHTNSGIYSSPLSDVVAITPNNFTLQLQDSTPADVLLPQAIDNQIVVLSGDDAHQMLWDGINNAYTSDIVSVISEQVIRSPVDETAFADLHRAGSRYVFIINGNGSMAIFQTLISQNVAGFTPAILEQSYGNAGFLQAASSSDGRCWFLTGRDVATQGTANPIIDNGADQLKTQNATGFLSTSPTAITFITTGSLPTSTPQLETGIYYYAVATNSVDFYVYATYEDAVNDTNRILFSNFGSNTSLVPYPIVSSMFVEELTQDTYLDCATYYNGTALSTLSIGNLYNNQAVKMVGDGFGFDAIGINSSVTFEAHGVPVSVSEAYVGFPINTIMEPMPLSMSNGQSAKNTTLTKPKHIRTIRFMFNDTIGGTINGVPIALEPFDQAHIGEPPFPGRGYVELGLNGGWDDFNQPSYTIFHNDPFNIVLLGVFYDVET